jgi:hypothetical protein
MSDLILAVIVLPALLGLFLAWYFWPRKNRNQPDRLAYGEIMYEINRSVHGAMDELGICSELKTDEDSPECFEALKTKLTNVIESDARLIPKTKISLLDYLKKVIDEQRRRKQQASLIYEKSKFLSAQTAAKHFRLHK